MLGFLFPFIFIVLSLQVVSLIGPHFSETRHTEYFSPLLQDKQHFEPFPKKSFGIKTCVAVKSKDPNLDRLSKTNFH